MSKHSQNRCPVCNRNVDIIEIPLTKLRVRALLKVYRWAIGDKPTVLDNVCFDMKDVRGMFNHSEYASFGDLVYFSDILQKDGKGRYIINLAKAEKFLKGEMSIPLIILKNPVTKGVEHKNWGTVKDIPSIMEFLNEDGNYVPTYHPNAI